jgi:ATP-dependent RNA helicase RhlE
VEVSAKLIEPEKERQVVKFLMKNLDGDGAFQEKKSKKNLGGPGVTEKKPWICQS